MMDLFFGENSSGFLAVNYIRRKVPSWKLAKVLKTQRWIDIRPNNACVNLQLKIAFVFILIFLIFSILQKKFLINVVS